MNNAKENFGAVCLLRCACVYGDIRETVYISTPSCVEVCCHGQAVLWGRSIQLQQQQFCTVCLAWKSIIVGTLGTNLLCVMFTSKCVLNNINMMVDITQTEVVLLCMDLKAKWFILEVSVFKGSIFDDLKLIAVKITATLQ